jgi:hypothetical protein
LLLILLLLLLLMLVLLHAATNVNAKTTNTNISLLLVFLWGVLGYPREQQRTLSRWFDPASSYLEGKRETWWTTTFLAFVSLCFAFSLHGREEGKDDHLLFWGGSLLLIVVDLLVIRPWKKKSRTAQTEGWIFSTGVAEVPWSGGHCNMMINKEDAPWILYRWYRW